MKKEKIYYPLTSNQKLLYYAEEAWPGTPTFNLIFTLKLFGEIDLSILEKTINLIILKNDGLRLRLIKINKGIKWLFSVLFLKTSFIDVIKNIFYKKFSLVKQYVSEYQEKKIEFIKFTTDNTEWIKYQSTRLFNLYDSDLFSFILLKLNTGEYEVFIRIHHIIADGWSLIHIGKQIGEYYTKIKNGLPVDLNRNPSYIDLILKDEKYKKTKIFKMEKKAWKNKMENTLESAMFKNKAKYQTNGNRKYFQLSPEMSETVNILCKKLHIYPSILFAAVLIYLIESKTSENDITLIMVSHNRVNKNEMNTVGMYARSTPIRVKLDEKINLKTLTNKILTEYKFSLRYGKEAAIADLFERSQQFIQFNILITNEKYIPDNTGIINSYEFHATGYVPNPLIFRIHEDESARLRLEYQYQTTFFSDSDIDEMHQDIEKITIQLGESEIG